ncbi:MAG: transcriptional repressor NrdR [Nanoarchaeota archaeon]|nr:transcriptional repressor NrdR [Nanoarchaeota archaeon]
MICPFCGNAGTRVIDKRNSNEGLENRRRRVCLLCSKRFTTYEKVRGNTIFVIKKDGSKELFNHQKILDGLIKACKKRSISREVINQAIRNVEKKVFDEGISSINSARIGALVMSELEKIDGVAYLRFASIYKEFNNINSFEKELKNLRNNKEVNIL